MKKMKLVLDGLQVDSFAVAPERVREIGTVKGLAEMEPVAAAVAASGMGTCTICLTRDFTPCYPCTVQVDWCMTDP